MTCCYLDLGSASDWLKINFVSSNQKHYPGLASDSSSVWNICPHSVEIDYLKVDSWRCEMSAVFSRLVFTGNGVRFRIVIRSVELNELVKTAFWFFLLRLRLRCLQTSANWVVTWECALWLVYPSVSASDSGVSGVGRKWKRSDSSESDSVALMTPLTSQIFLFSLGHKRSFDSAYDSNSDSIACENHPSDQGFCCGSIIFYRWFKFYFPLFLGMLNYIIIMNLGQWKMKNIESKIKTTIIRITGILNLALMNSLKSFISSWQSKYTPYISLILRFLLVPKKSSLFGTLKGYFGGINFQTHFDPTYLTPLYYQGSAA